MLVKAVSGGGGRGIRLAQNEEDLLNVVTSASQEAKLAFGDEGVYIEKFIRPARHIEVQILGDGKGNVLVIGERECSIQRRHQKLIEESPAPGTGRADAQAPVRGGPQGGPGAQLPQPGHGRVPDGRTTRISISSRSTRASRWSIP